MCWRIGTQSADAFVASGLAEMDAKFVRGKVVRIYFQLNRGTPYWVVKAFKNPSGFSLARLVQCIEGTVYAAIAHHLQREAGMGAVTVADVRRLLGRATVCRLLVRRPNQVFVNLKQPERS